MVHNSLVNTGAEHIHAALQSGIRGAGKEHGSKGSFFDYLFQLLLVVCLTVKLFIRMEGLVLSLYLSPATFAFA